MSSALMVERGRGANTDRLNAQQRLFVEHLMGDDKFNASNAARKAGYKNPSQSANKLLHNKIVAAHIGKRLKERADALALDANRVLEELAKIGYFNPKRLFDNDGNLIQINELPDEVAACIQSIDVQTRMNDDGSSTITTKIRFHDKLQALDMLARHLGMYAALKSEVKHSLDWDALIKRPMGTDPVEAEIAKMKSQAIESKRDTL